MPKVAVSWCLRKYFKIRLLLRDDCNTDLSSSFRLGGEQPFPKYEPFCILSALYLTASEILSSLPC